jgi:6,7-dimethyl-8-ribityllumazine synthase
MKSDTHAPLPDRVEPSWRVGIVASTYHGEIIDRLVEGARGVFREAGLPEANVRVHRAPGSFEVPLIGAALADSRAVDALIGFGVIVQGQTHHARLLAENVTRAMMDIQVRERLPFAFEILYVDDLDQARERAEGATNKGREAAYAVLHSLAELRAIALAKRDGPR